MIFQSSKGPIYYERHGERRKQPLLFLHALGSDHRMFDEQTKRFSDEWFVLVVDLPWHGQSYIPKRILDFDEITQCLKELLDHLECLDVVVSGVSLGGYVAQHFAFNHPERVKALHLDGAHPLHLSFNKMLKILAYLHSVVTRLAPKWIIYSMASVVLSTDKASRHVVRAHFKRYGRNHLIHLSEGAKKALIQGIEHPPSHPVLMTIGEKEFGFVRRRCEKWNALNDKTNLLEILGGNHLHIKQYPQAFESSLKAFMNSIHEW